MTRQSWLRIPWMGVGRSHGEKSTARKGAPRDEPLEMRLGAIESPQENGMVGMEGTSHVEGGA